MFDAARSKLSDWLKPEHVYPQMPPAFEPTEPPYDVALGAFQFFLEMSRRHPEDQDLLLHTEQARQFMTELWERDHAPAL